MAERSDILARRRRQQQRVRARQESMLFVRRAGVLLAALLILIIAGTAGFVAIEGVSAGYALEWTLDTVTTLGTIPDPHDFGGRALKVGLEIFGIGTLFYGLAMVAEFFVSGQLNGLLADRRMQKTIDSYDDHYIICGYGRVGRQVARDLRAGEARYVVVDDNPDNRDAAQASGILYIERPAADDEVLREAGIERARGVIACNDSDAENIFIALTARELRSDIMIIARASAEDSEKKLLRAGADRVISPYKTSGSEMARIALHPQVAAALDVADFRMEEIEVSPSCVGAGKTIEDVRGQSVIVAVRRPDGELEPHPEPASVLNPGDMLIALGTPAALERLEGLFEPASGVAS